MTKRLAINACPRLDILMLHRMGALASGADSRMAVAAPNDDNDHPRRADVPMHHLETKVLR